MMVLSSRGTARTSSRVFDPVGDARVTGTLLSSLCSFQKPPGTSLPDFIESSFLENPIWYRNVA